MRQEFYTVEEAAKLLRVSRQTVYRLLQTMKLRGIRVSERRTVIPAGAIEALTSCELRGGEDTGEAQTG